MVLSRLQGDSDAGLLQAIDELYVHHLLSQSCDPRYEEDATSPDFRLYKPSGYVASMEVLTLFTENDFTSEVSRNQGLVDEINRRVRPAKWYVSFRIIKWARQPRPTHIARWLEESISTLPHTVPKVTNEDYPTAIYSTPEVELEFTFIPRRQTTEATATEPVVVAGPVVVQFVQPARRLRRALSQKGGGRYNNRNRPFAIVVSVRDYLCDTEDIIDALYGDDAVSIEIENPGSIRPFRKRNGTFAISAANPEGRNRRLSCVFALLRGWTPGLEISPTVLRFDNPMAEQTFPDDLLIPDRRMVARHDNSDLWMEWQ